jgi:hypothetical protein
MLVSVGLLALVSGYGFGAATSPQPAIVRFQAGSLIIPTDQCYQLGQDNNSGYQPEAAMNLPALISYQWATDQSSCTYYTSVTTSSTTVAPTFGAASGGGHYCWAASTTVQLEQEPDR